MTIIENQIHYINPEYSGDKVETVSLKELFGNYKENPKQIIRGQKDFYKLITLKLLKGEINLFNTVNDEVNNKLIIDFQEGNKIEETALISEIYGEKLIIKENSLKVVQVLEMGNYSLRKIYKNELYKNGIKDFTDIKELLEWLSKEFYKGNIDLKNILEEKKLFFRQIKLINNKL